MKNSSSQNPLRTRHHLLTEISHGFAQQKFVPTLIVGTIAGILEVVLAISFAALIYAETLANFVANGIGLFLLANIIFLTVVTLFSSQPGSVAAIQSIPVAILAVVAGSIAANLQGSASSDTIFFTVVITMGLATLLTGLLFWGLGQFKLGGLVRFLPYSVIGGFLAGTGWLLVVGSIGTMIGQPAEMNIFQPELLGRWLPGMLFAVSLMLVLRQKNHPMVIPVFVIGGSVLFFVIAYLGQTSVASLSSAGWLLGPFPDGRLWQPVALTELAQVPWQTVGQQAVNIGTVLVMSAVALLLNGSGLETATRREIDLNHELKVAGTANILAGLTGGVVGYQQLSISAINLKMGLENRLTGLIAAAVCGGALLFGASALALFPRVILGGLLFYLGLTFLKEWVFDAWGRLPWLDYAVVLLILLVTAVVGFWEAVGVGLIAAILLFVVNYSRINIVRHELSGHTQQSRVTRTLSEQDFLRDHGDQIYILLLQGYIFFGTADNLVHTVRERINNPSLASVQFILFDFRRVTAIDATTRLSFRKLAQLADANDITLLFTELSPQIQQQMDFQEMDVNGRIQTFPDLDRGLAWCEEKILLTHNQKPDEKARLAQHLYHLLPEPKKIEKLLPHFTRLDLPAGHYLMHQGDPPDALYFIESGQITAQLEHPMQKPLRLQTMRGGHVVGEIGFYLRQDRTAAVLTDEPSVVYELTQETMQGMEKIDPEAASFLHQLIIHMLAARVTHLVDTVNVLQI